MSSNRRFAFVCLAQLLIGAPLAIAQALPASALPLDTVVAKQGTATVTLADIDAFAARIDQKQRAGFFDNPKRLDSLISNLLVQRQLADEAKAAGLDKKPAVQAQLRIADEDILGNARLEQLRSELKLPDFDQLAHEEYLANKEKYVKVGQVDVEHILISTQKHSDDEAKALAEDVRKQAVAHPAEFEAFIEKYSEDQSKAQNHGLMTDASSARYAAPFATAAGALKVPGEISPVVKTKFGYHVLKLVKRTTDTPPKFEDFKPQIVEQLRASYVDKTVTTHSNELRNLPIDAKPDVVASLRDRYGKMTTATMSEAEPAAPAPAGTKP